MTIFHYLADNVYNDPSLQYFTNNQWNVNTSLHSTMTCTSPNNIDTVILYHELSALKWVYQSGSPIMTDWLILSPKFMSARQATRQNFIDIGPPIYTNIYRSTEFIVDLTHPSCRLKFHSPSSAINLASNWHTFVDSHFPQPTKGLVANAVLTGTIAFAGSSSRTTQQAAPTPDPQQPMPKKKIDYMNITKGVIGR